MHTLKYIIEGPKITALLREFCPEVMGCIQHFNLKRPSLILRRAVVLALVRRHLRDTYHLALEDSLKILIRHESSGAPYLLLPENINVLIDVHISISHTGPWVAFILSNLAEPITIDIENIKKPRAYTKIAASIFSKKEQRYVAQYGLLGFYYLWCAKEALAKWHKQDLEFALSIDLSDQLCSPSQNTNCIIGYREQCFAFTFFLEDTILTTTCTRY